MTYYHGSGFCDADFRIGLAGLGLDSAELSQALALPPAVRYDTLLERGWLARYFAALENGVAERAAALRTELRRLHPDLRFAFHASPAPADWFSLGLLRGLSTREVPVLLWLGEPRVGELARGYRDRGIYGLAAVRIEADRATFADLLTLPSHTLRLSAFQREGDAIVGLSPMVEVARGMDTAVAIAAGKPADYDTDEPRRVAVCRHSPCTGRWTEQDAVSNRFQALVKRGSSVVARSRVVRVTWTAPPLPPPATPGHYEGRSTFNEAFDLDVSADGKSVVNLRTGQINESCNPSAHISGGNLTAPGPYAIAADGSFSIAATITITVGDSTGTRSIKIAGRFAGTSASGTIRTDTTFTLDGTGYVCNSGDQTWSASKVG